MDGSGWTTQLIRRLPAVCGAAGFFVIAGGIVWASTGDPDFSPHMNYISELALPHNPHSSVLNTGFMLGGALAAAFLVSLAIRADERAIRRAAACGALGAIGLIGVGYYPVTEGATHLAAAAFAMVFSFAGSMQLYGSERRSRVFSLLLAAQLLFVVGAATYVAVALASEDGLTLAPRIDIGAIVNPYCLFEWGFVGTATLLLLGVSAADLAGATSRASLPRGDMSRSRPSS